MVAWIRGIIVCAFVVWYGNNLRGGPKPEKLVSAEPTCYKEVTAKLNPGGGYYFFMDTRNFGSQLGGMIDKVKEIMLSDKNASDLDVKKAELWFKFAHKIIGESGICEISGIGMSSIAIKKGFYHNKFFLYHCPDADKGLIWKLPGKKPHPLDSLKLLPASTVIAGFFDFNPGFFWKWVRKQAAESGIPELQKGLAKINKELSESNFDLDGMLASLDNEMGMLITMDEKKQALFPIPGTQTFLQVPEPAVAIVLKVKDNRVFKYLCKQLKQGKPVKKPGIELLVFPMNMPMPVKFMPTIASTKDLLIVASNPDLIEDMLKVRKTGKGGLTETAEFKDMAKHIDLNGNGFKFASPRLSKTIEKAVKKFMNEGAKDVPDSTKQMVLNQIDSFFGKFKILLIMRNSDEGWFVVSNANSNIGDLAMFQGTMMPSILAGMLLPALNKARDRARTVSCANNLKQIGLGMVMYANDHKENFPVPDGAAGLEIIRKGDYITDPKIFVCPSSGTKPARPGQTLAEDTVDYIYLGGFSAIKSKLPSVTPLAFDKPGNHKNEVNVLFMDGHVERIRAPRYDNPVQVIDFVNLKYKLPPELYKKLRQKAENYGKKPNRP